MLAGDGDGLLHRQVLRITSLAGGHPRPRFPTTEDAELEGAPTSDSAEVVAWKLLIVLELKPVDEAILAAVSVHRVQQRLAVEVRQLIRPEAATESCVELVQLGT